jgi:hypothetical protein
MFGFLMWRRFEFDVPLPRTPKKVDISVCRVTRRPRRCRDSGVLTLRIPVPEHAKPRKISVGSGNGRKQIKG